jgi:hypothetical protein
LLSYPEIRNGLSLKEVTPDVAVFMGVLRAEYANNPEFAKMVLKGMEAYRPVAPRTTKLTTGEKAVKSSQTSSPIISNKPIPGYPRIITEKSRLWPEDIGIRSEEFFKESASNSLLGSITLKKDVLRVKIDYIEVGQRGYLGSWLKVMDNLKRTAFANNAKTLIFEARIINKDLLRVMTKRYGSPYIIYENYSSTWIYSWDIPVTKH